MCFLLLSYTYQEEQVAGKLSMIKQHDQQICMYSIFRSFFCISNSNDPGVVLTRHFTTSQFYAAYLSPTPEQGWQ